MPNISNNSPKIDPSKMDNVDILRLYDFNFIQSAMEAFIYQLIVRFRKFRQDFPVYLFNSGDEFYLLNEQRIIGAGTKFKRSDVYQTKPRLEITINGLQIQSDQFTSNTQEGLFTIPIERRDVTFHGPVERIPINLDLKAILVCDSLLHSFMYTELVLTMINDLTTFEFWHAKRRHVGVFNIQMQIDVEKKLDMSFSADTRDYILNIPINLALQFPAFDFFNPLKNTIKPTTSSVLKDIEFGIYPDGGAGDKDGDQVDDAPIKDIISADEDDTSSDAMVGNAHTPVILPGQNPDGSPINTNKPSYGKTDDNTGWQDTASTPELSSQVLDSQDENQVGKTTHYPM